MKNYKKYLNQKWMVLVLLGCVILVGVVISNYQVTASPQEDSTIVSLGEDKQLKVSYLIGVDNQANELIGRVEYESSITGVEQYREFNNREMEKLLANVQTMDDVPVKITFNSALDQLTFAQFVEQYEVKVDSYIIYMVESSGNIATIQGSPSNTELVPAEFFNSAIASVSQEYNSGADLLGWVEVDGTVKAGQILKIQNDQRIFLVDVMQLFLESKLTGEALTRAGIPRGRKQELLQAGFTEIYRAPIAWQLYHLGIMDLEAQE